MKLKKFRYNPYLFVGPLAMLSLLMGGCTPVNTLGATAACTELVLDYALLRDQGDVEGYTALFSETASLTLRGKTITGTTAIRQRIGEARNGPMTRHLMSTIRITPIDANRATGISYATIYAAARPDSGPAVVPGFTVIGNYVDEFVRTAQGWRIQSRVLEEAFLFKDG